MGLLSFHCHFGSRAAPRCGAQALRPILTDGVLLSVALYLFVNSQDTIDSMFVKILMVDGFQSPIHLKGELYQ